MSAFDGFPPDAWRLLDLLAQDNTAACFDQQRYVYRSAIAAPSHALVEALVPRLASEVHPTLTGEARVGRSLFRTNRDTRFATDKTPYKTYVDFLFWAGEGDPRSSAACIRFETELRSAGLAENTVRTYVDRSRYFVRWLDGDYSPGASHI